MADETVLVYWYDCRCDVWTKYCDEHHQKSARVPRAELEKYAAITEEKS